MTDQDLLQECNQLLCREAMLVDRKLWQEWLELFTEDVEFWMPAWTDQCLLTADPARELSLIYIKGKGGLQDRVFRIESGDSFASTPMDRTVHVIGGVVVTSREPQVTAEAAWVAHSFGIRGKRTLAGRSIYTLERQGETLKVARKR
ncbi:MAG: aromatic-ring-hydroxylating dioxygenase subunit beta, partial [Pirellulales bacterium]